MNTARGLAKSYGEQLQKGSTQKIREIAKGLSQELRGALDPLFGEIRNWISDVRAIHVTRNLANWL